MRVGMIARLVARSMPMAAPVPMSVADVVSVPAAPVHMAVADTAAMAVMMVMPMAMATMHLHEQIAFGVSGFRDGRLRCDGRGGDRSEQSDHSNDGRCQGHLRQHGSLLSSFWGVRRP
jgi:hypothetical protein